MGDEKFVFHERQQGGEDGPQAEIEKPEEPEKEKKGEGLTA
jgi:hypothetical protein